MRNLRILACLVLLMTGGVTAFAQSTYTWQPTTDGNWSVASNWFDQNSNTGAPASGSTTTLNFGGSSIYTATNDISAFTVNALNFSNTFDTTIASSVVGNTITLNGSNAAINVASGSGAVTITSGLVVSSDSMITNNGFNALTLGAVSYNSGTTTTFTGSGNILATKTQTFQDNTSLTYSGSGTLALGPTAAGAAFAFGSGNTVSINNGVNGSGNTGTLTLNDTGTGSNYAGTNVTVNLANYSTGAFNIGNFAGVSGTLNINAGTVQFAGATGGDLFGNGLTLNVASGATFNFANNPETMGAISGNGTITGANVSMTITGNHTWGGVIAGTNTFSTGAANVNYTFTGNNTSTGNTTVVANSSLTLGNGGTSGIVSGNLVNSGTLTFNRSDNFSYAKVISGVGTVVQGGTGTLTLSGANTYTGNTFVNSGTLAFTSAAALPTGTKVIAVADGAVLDVSAIPGGYTFGTGRTFIAGRSGTPANDVLGVVNVGGTLDIGGVGVIRTATFANDLTLNSATALFDLSSNPAANNDLLSVGGNLTLSGTSTIQVNKTSGGLSSGSYALVNYAGSLTGDASNLTVVGLGGSNTRQSFNLDTGAGTNSSISLIVTGSAANLTWVGNSGNNVWDLVTTSNFTGATGSTPDNRYYNLDVVTFDGTGVGGATPVTVTGNLNPASVTVNGTQDYTFSGTGSLGGTGTFTKNGTGILTLAVANTSTGLTTLNNGTLSVVAGGSISGPVAVNGGTLLVTATNSFASSLTLSGGATIVGNGSTIGDLGTAAVVFAGGSLTVNRSDDIPYANTTTVTAPGSSFTNAGSGTITVSSALAFGGNSFEIGGSGNTILTGAISGTGTLTKSGTGTLTLGSSSNGFTGTLVINGGHFNLQDISGGDMSPSLITVNNGGVFQFGVNAGENPDLPDATYITINTGGEAIFKIGEQFGGINLLGGTLTLNGGTAGGLVGTTHMDWRSGTVNGITANGTSGAGQIDKTTTGTVFVTGLATIGNVLNILEGTVSFATASNLGSAAINLGGSSTNGTVEYLGATATRGGAFTLNSGGGTVNVGTAGTTLTLSGAMSGTGVLSKIGDGTLALSGTGSYTGGVTVNAGTLLVNGNSSAASGAITVGSGGTLGGTGTLGGAATIQSGGVVRGDSGTGTGTLTTGNVTVNNGGAIAANLGASGTSSQLAVAGNTLNLLSGSKLSLTALSGFDGTAGSFTLATLTDGNNLQLDGASQSDGFSFGKYVQGTGATGAIAIDTSALNFTLNSGDTFELNRVGNNLVLSFTPVPEPATVLAIGAAGFGLFGWARRKRKAK